MSELLNTLPSASQNFPFINEIIHLRQAQVENETLKQLNTLYKSQVSNLEVELSELKAQLTAKDCELKNLKEKIHKRSQSYNSSRVHLMQPQVEQSGRSVNLVREISYLNNLVESERRQKMEFEAQLNKLQVNLDKSREVFCKQNLEKIASLEAIVVMLTEENENLKAKALGFEIGEPSTAHKSFNSTEIKISSIDTESVSVAESTPRVEGPILDIHDSGAFNCYFSNNSTPQKFSNPEPPKTRLQNDYPKKVRTSNPTIKYISCNLSDILATPPKSRFADFCPSYMRKFK